MASLKPADIFVIQSAIAQYERKFPKKPTPSAEVALAWLMERRSGRARIPLSPPMEISFLGRVLDNLRFLFRPLSSAPR